jgi:hypothetical protein
MSSFLTSIIFLLSDEGGDLIGYEVSRISIEPSPAKCLSYSLL